MVLELLLLSCLFYFLWFIYSTMQQRRTLPPGPFPIPLIGNAHLLGKNMPYSMEHLREKYGDVYTVAVPSGKFIVVNSGKVMYEMLVKSKDDFANRPTGSRLIASDLFNNKAVPFVPYGPFYVFVRKVITYALHMYGEGLKTAENRVNEEVEHLLTRIEETDGEPFCPKEHISQTITNVTLSWLLSERYEFGNPIFKTLRTFVDNVLYVGHQWINMDFLPFYAYLPLDVPKRFRQALKVRDEYFGRFLEEHRESYQDGVIRDIADALLAAYEKEKTEGKGRDIGTSDDIKTIMMDFFIASSDTTSATLTWFILYMVLNQNIQKKVHEELDGVVGRNRSPCWDDTENLPFLQATICETIRHASPVPLLGRKTLRETKIKEYKIPEDTKILLNMWYVNNDPEEWDEPTAFNPGRFLDENGKFRGWSTSTSFYPFGAGIRSCLGQSLAKMNLLVVASNLLHRFRFHVPKDKQGPTLESEPGGVRYPRDFLVVVSERK